MSDYKQLLSTPKIVERLTSVDVTELVTEISKYDLGPHSKDAKYMQYSPLTDLKSFIIKEVNWDFKCSGDYTNEMPAFTNIILELFDCDKIWLDQKLQRAYYTELNPGKVVKPHHDGNHRYFDKVDRFHIYVSEEDDEVDLYCNNQRLKYNLGDVWRFDLGKEHWAENKSSRPMKLFVFDLLRNN